MRIGMIVTTLLFSTSLAHAQGNEGYVPPPLTEWKAGIGGWRSGDTSRPTVPEGAITTYYDKKSGKRVEGVVVRTIKIIDQKEGGIVPEIGDKVTTRGYEVLVPPTTASGESKIVFVSPDGIAKGEASISDWISGRNQQIADSIRHAKSGSKLTARQLDIDDARRRELEARVGELNRKYGTVEGLRKVGAEVAIAVIIDQIKLPEQYTGLTKNETKVVNVIAGAHIGGIGAAAGKAVSGGNAGQVAAEGGISTGIDVTLAPFLLQQVGNGKLSQEDAAVLIALGKAVVKATAEGVSTKDPSFEKLQRQFYDQLADVVPGAGVLAKDLDEIGLSLIDYYGFVWELTGSAGNQNAVANNFQWAISAQRALANFSVYEEKIRARNGVSYVPPVVVTGPVFTTDTGWNGARADNTRPGTTPASQPSGSSSSFSAGTKR